MRIRLAITLTLGDKPEPSDDGDRYNDAMGSHHDAPSTDLHLGFTTPALTTEDE